jgi:glyoxylase-like metal-dependent hydrolase (beta-lactamase superfamily II)
MEIISDIHRISTQTAKPLHLYVLKGQYRTILLDSGMAQAPDEVILPYFAKEGIDAEGPLDVIVTHADCDHCGGDGEMKRLCPQSQIHVSTQDRVMVEDPRRLMSNRYEAYEREHGLAYDEATKDWLAEAAGRAQEIDSTLAPGQRIRLSQAWDVEILPLPGHTLGHIMIWDPRHRIAFIGDGVLGHGEYDLEGRLFAPPTYVTARGYLESIDRLESLNPEIVLRGHRDPHSWRRGSNLLDGEQGVGSSSRIGRRGVSACSRRHVTLRHDRRNW